jgi:hypothetical protein
VSASSAAGASDTRRHRVSAEHWQPQRADLIGRRVPLDARREERHRDRMRELWVLAGDAHPTSQPELLYRHTFGLKAEGNGQTRTTSASGAQLPDLVALFQRYPLGWLVAAFVVAAAKGVRFDAPTIEAFIAPWLGAKPAGPVSPAHRPWKDPRGDLVGGGAHGSGAPGGRGGAPRSLSSLLPQQQ